MLKYYQKTKLYVLLKPIQDFSTKKNHLNYSIKFKTSSVAYTLFRKSSLFAQGLKYKIIQLS